MVDLTDEPATGDRQLRELSMTLSPLSVALGDFTSGDRKHEVKSGLGSCWFISCSYASLA